MGKSINFADFKVARWCCCYFFFLTSSILNKARVNVFFVRGQKDPRSLTLVVLLANKDQGCGSFAVASLAVVAADFVSPLSLELFFFLFPAVEKTAAFRRFRCLRLHSLSGEPSSPDLRTIEELCCPTEDNHIGTIGKKRQHCRCWQAIKLA